jgi:hypothetical protein
MSNNRKITVIYIRFRHYFFNTKIESDPQIETRNSKL